MMDICRKTLKIQHLEMLLLSIYNNMGENFCRRKKANLLPLKEDII